jgi:hypothetical protein
MKRHALWFLTFLSLVALTQSAQAAVRISFVGNLTYSDQEFSRLGSTTLSSSPKMAPGGGMLFDFSLGDRASLEIGALFTTRSADVTRVVPLGTQKFSVTSHHAEVPVLIRLWANPLLNFGAGGYYAYGLGKIHRGNISGTSTSDFSFGDFDQSRREWGLVGSVAIHIPASNLIDILLDGRYYYSMTDSNTSNISMQFRDIQGLMGIVFKFGGPRR